MAASRFVSLLLALVGVSFFAQVAHALRQSLDQKDADAAIAKFLASNKSDSEGAESQGSAVADLNGDGKPEIVLVWTTMGPTYWHNTLTVFPGAAAALGCSRPRTPKSCRASSRSDD